MALRTTIMQRSRRLLTAFDEAGARGVGSYILVAMLNRAAKLRARCTLQVWQMHAGRRLMTLRTPRLLIQGGSFGEALFDATNSLTLLEEVQSQPNGVSSELPKKVKLDATTPWASTAQQELLIRGLHSLKSQSAVGISTTRRIRQVSSSPTPRHSIRVPASFHEYQLLVRDRSLHEYAVKVFPQLGIDRYDYGSCDQGLTRTYSSKQLADDLEACGLTRLEGAPFVILYENDQRWKASARGSTSKMSQRRFEVENALRVTIREGYWSAIQSLLSRGAALVRLGRSSVPLPAHSQNLYDLALEPTTASRRLELFLPAMARFAISTGSGADSVAHMWRTPRLMLNWYSLHKISILRNALIVPRTFTDRHGQPVAWSQVARHEAVCGVQYSESFWAQAGMYLRDLELEVVQVAVDEMWSKTGPAQSVIPLSDTQRLWSEKASNLDVYETRLRSLGIASASARTVSLASVLLADPKSWTWA